MSNEPIILRKTPFVFLRMLVIIEFFFALLPLVATLIFPVRDEYNQTALAQSLSYSVLFTIVLTSLQFLIAAISFFSWYLPAYQIDRHKIAYKRLGASDFQELTSVSAVTHVKVRQSWLGRRFGYGTLRMTTNSASDIVKLKDISNPLGTANQIRGWSVDHSNESRPLEIPPPHELIASGEGQFVEFKSSILWDYRQEKTNKDLSIPIIKNVAAFMNSEGGALLIGINDEGDVLGLKADFAVMKKPNPDGYELIFNNAFNQMVGIEFRRYVQLSFPEIEGKIICLVTVRPATRPVYFKHHGREDFYIRAGNTSQPLSVSKVTAYIQEHFKL